MIANDKFYIYGYTYIFVFIYINLGIILFISCLGILLTFGEVLIKINLKVLLVEF